MIFIQPLADKLRPQTLEDIFGQSHVIGEGKLINKLIENNAIHSLILYGPPGCGKSSLANIIAKSMNKKYIKLNAINCGTKDIREAINSTERTLFYDGVLLQIEEFHHFNKKQQQSLLEVIEDGRVTLITTTTENPYFTIFKSIISRSTLIELKPLNSQDILLGLKRAVEKLKVMYPNKNINCDLRALETIANTSNGDMRSALNTLSNLFNFSFNKNSKIINLTMDNLKLCSTSTNMHYDNADIYYSTLSAFHKSVRGSNPDAALIYLSTLLKCGPLEPIHRRILCIAAEDVSMADPQAIILANSCVEASLKLGLPEAKLPLSLATVYLSLAKKSFSTTRAINMALHDIDTIDIGDIPLHLKDAHYKDASKLNRGVNYKFPHDFPNNYVEQQYLPDNIKDRIYYIPGDNDYENALKEYWENIKNKSELT